MTLPAAVTEALTTLDRLVQQFGTQYPSDCTVDGVYPLRKAQFGAPEGGNTEWTTSFYPGMLWVAGELTGDQKWFEAARSHIPSFKSRIEERLHVDHHDLGFLYSISCVPAWRLEQDEVAKAAALEAADYLLTRYLPSAEIIQAWGALGDPTQQGRAIIDSLLNMPLLYWATEVTGDRRYYNIAARHAQQLRDHIIREDNSTFHTYFFDVETGEPLRGKTAQGYADDSCWARGQAWGIYGFVLNYLHTGDATLLEASERCARYFLDHLPKDKVAYWDLVFTDGSTEERDSSAAAIAVCGLVELAKATGKAEYQQAADEILDSLIENYSTKGEEPYNCLLLHSVYSKPGNNGVDEGSLWGDYYYVEALMRRERPDWVSYWQPTK